MPKYVIGPAALRQAIRQELRSQINIVAGSTDRLQGNANIHYEDGMIDVIEPRLDADSSTAWYLAADYRQEPTVQVAELRGMSTPWVLELPVQTSARRRWEVTFCSAAKAMSYRGLYQGNT